MFFRNGTNFLQVAKNSFLRKFTFTILCHEYDDGFYFLLSCNEISLFPSKLNIHELLSFGFSLVLIFANGIPKNISANLAKIRRKAQKIDTREN